MERARVLGFMHLFEVTEEGRGVGGHLFLQLLCGVSKC